MTIKQIIDCEETYGGSNEFRIDNATVTQVTFVGQVRAVTQQSTHVNYKLDDGTGVIEVKKWVDADKMQTEPGAEPLLELDKYARVWGRLKSFSNKKHVGAHVIRPVTDHNEVNYHLLEAAYVHLYFTRGPLGQQGAGNQAGAGANGGGGEDGMFVGGAGGAGTGGGGGGMGNHLASVSAQGRKMYTYLLQTPGGNEGVHTDLIAQSTGMTVRDVKTAMDELLGAGVVYTTLDDDTYAVLET